jgi:hypothetical protein
VCALHSLTTALNYRVVKGGGRVVCGDPDWRSFQVCTSPFCFAHLQLQSQYVRFAEPSPLTPSDYTAHLTLLSQPYISMNSKYTIID